MNCKDSNRTPPAPAATAGAIRTLDFLRTSTASGVHGMFEPRYKMTMMIAIIKWLPLVISEYQNRRKYTANMHATSKYYLLLVYDNLN